MNTLHSIHTTQYVEAPSLQKSEDIFNKIENFEKIFVCDEFMTKLYTLTTPIHVFIYVI